MSAEDRAELPPRPSELDALQGPVMSSAQKASLLLRIETSMLVAAPALVLPHAAAAMGRLIPAKLAVSIGLATLGLGAVGGALFVRYLVPSEPTVVERVVVQTKEVRVEVPVPVTPPIQPQEPAPAHHGPATPPTAPKPDSSLERQEVEAVRTALMRQDPGSALKTLDRLEREFPAGRFQEERDSLRIQALQQSGDDAAARAAARTFLKHYPSSVFGAAAEAVLRPTEEAH
jgi:hypothetical protein